MGNRPVVPTGSARKSRLVSWRTLSQSRATSFSERGLGIGCYSASRPLLMLLLLPFSQQAPSVRCALHGRARGPAEISDRGGDSAIPPLWKNPGASIGLSNRQIVESSNRRMPRRRRSGGIAGIVSHNPMDGGCVTSVDRHQTYVNIQRITQCLEILLNVQ